jgi:hypothetical protein
LDIALPVSPIKFNPLPNSTFSRHSVKTTKSPFLNYRSLKRPTGSPKTKQFEILHMLSGIQLD